MSNVAQIVAEEAAEAELARLREPAGEVEEVVRELNKGSWDQTVIQGPNPTSFCVDRTPLVQRAADLLTRQAAEIEMAKAFIEEQRQWMANLNKANGLSEARLREAVDVMRGIAAIARTSAGPGYSAIAEAIRLFLSTLETNHE